MNCLQLNQVISYLARFLVGDPIFPDSISWNWGGPLNTLSLVPMYTHVKFDSVIIHLSSRGFYSLNLSVFIRHGFYQTQHEPPGTCHPCHLQAVSQCWMSVIFAWNTISCFCIGLKVYTESFLPWIFLPQRFPQCCITSVPTKQHCSCSFKGVRYVKTSIKLIFLTFQIRLGQIYCLTSAIISFIHNKLQIWIPAYSR